jgi:hypothetical protein
MRSSLSSSVDVTEFQTTDAYSTLNLTNEKYNMNIIQGMKSWKLSCELDNDDDDDDDDEDESNLINTNQRYHW